MHIGNERQVEAAAADPNNAWAEYVGKLREAAKIERMDKPAEAAAKPDAKPADPAKPAEAAKDSKMAPAKK